MLLLCVTNSHQRVRHWHELRRYIICDSLGHIASQCLCFPVANGLARAAIRFSLGLTS